MPTSWKQSAQVSDNDLNKQYQDNIAQYQVPNRVTWEHILLFTRGKTTDAQNCRSSASSRGSSERSEKGREVRDLAKKILEDTQTKDKGGDLGWITQGQTVAALRRCL